MNNIYKWILTGSGGRALAFGGTVTTDTDTISSPVCSTSTVTPTTIPTSTPDEPIIPDGKGGLI